MLIFAFPKIKIYYIRYNKKINEDVNYIDYDIDTKIIGFI